MTLEYNINSGIYSNKDRAQTFKLFGLKEKEKYKFHMNIIGEKYDKYNFVDFLMLILFKG